MNTTEYYQLVARMRAEQQKYFDGDRSRTQLARCQHLEGRVDAATAEYLGRLAKQAKLNLL